VRKVASVAVLEDVRMWMIALASEENDEEGLVRATLMMGMPLRRTRLNIAHMNSMSRSELTQFGHTWLLYHL